MSDTTVSEKKKKTAKMIDCTKDFAVWVAKPAVVYNKHSSLAGRLVQNLRSRSIYTITKKPTRYG